MALTQPPNKLPPRWSPRLALQGLSVSRIVLLLQVLLVLLIAISPPCGWWWVTPPQVSAAGPVGGGGGGGPSLSEECDRVLREEAENEMATYCADEMTALNNSMVGGGGTQQPEAVLCTVVHAYMRCSGKVFCEHYLDKCTESDRRQFFEGMFKNDSHGERMIHDEGCIAQLKRATGLLSDGDGEGGGGKGYVQCDFSAQTTTEHPDLEGSSESSWNSNSSSPTATSPSSILDTLFSWPTWIAVLVGGVALLLVLCIGALVCCFKCRKGGGKGGDSLEGDDYPQQQLQREYSRSPTNSASSFASPPPSRQVRSRKVSHVSRHSKVRRSKVGVVSPPASSSPRKHHKLRSNKPKTTMKQRRGKKNGKKTVKKVVVCK